MLRGGAASGVGPELFHQLVIETENEKRRCPLPDERAGVLLSAHLQRQGRRNRTALTIHRGTPNRSQVERPALVLGVDAPDARNAERHDLQFTRRAYETLPERITRHMTCRVVDELSLITQAHTIEGLVMGEGD